MSSRSERSICSCRAHRVVAVERRGAVPGRRQLAHPTMPLLELYIGPVSPVDFDPPGTPEGGRRVQRDHDCRRRARGTDRGASPAPRPRARCDLLEAHDDLGGRARSTDGPYKANLGPHVLYKDGPFWRWLRERDLMPPYARAAAVGDPVPLGGRPAPHAAAGDRARGPAAARPRRRRPTATSAAGRPTTPTRGPPQIALRRRRRLHLPPRPRRALGRVRLGAAPCGLLLNAPPTGALS